MSYAKAKDCWVGLETYNLSGRKTKNTREEYVPPVTMPFNEWQQYVASGNNVLLGSGGVIPSGTVQTAFGGRGAVFRGHVRQGFGGSGWN
tara:strand:+ start:375 stop:644 length:270 start_codon:yes stop_codon:yes gene_type:complete